MKTNEQRCCSKKQHAFTPLDKQIQQTLILRDNGVVHKPLEDKFYFRSKAYETEFVDPAPLPWEYEDCNEEESRHRQLISGNDLCNLVLNALVPIVEDIIASGLISARWSRANANMSTYFKCYHLYNPKEKNAPLLAKQMGRNRAIPERYASKFKTKMRSYQNLARHKIYRKLLTNELFLYAKDGSFPNESIDLLDTLKQIRSGLIEVASWDSEDPFDICAVVYANNESSPEHSKAILQLLEAGCTRLQITTTMDIIENYKQMENDHESI